MNLALRIVLLLWICGYLLAACGPILGGHLVIGTIGVLGGIIFFVPWLIGVVILAALIWITNPPPRR